jgi:hypothetical protein
MVDSAGVSKAAEPDGELRRLVEEFASHLADERATVALMSLEKQLHPEASWVRNAASSWQPKSCSNGI